MRKQLIETIVLGSALLTGGCATKKYVLNTTEPIRAKLDQIGGQTNTNAIAIDENRKEIKAVDERGESGISATRERVLTVENKAAEAMDKAAEAAKAAADARAPADKNTSELASQRTVVSTIDDYRLIAETNVQFAFGQDKLTPEAKEGIDKLAAATGNLKRFTIVVEGFTDKIGFTEYNNALSRRRSSAVVSYLVTKQDIPLYRISAEGLGSQKPADEGKALGARSKNRRVEVKIFSADQTASTVPQRAQ